MVVPAEVVQFVFPVVTDALRISVWSLVASVTPATFQPDPGSLSGTPITSINSKVPVPLSFAKPTASSPV